MRDGSSERAISTAVDATFALLLISASVLLLAVSLDTERTDQSQFDEADQLIETLNALEVSTSVTVANTLNDEVMYTYPRRGTAAELLAEATVSEARIHGIEYMNTSYERGIKGKLLNYLSQTGTNAQIRAVWEPSEHAPVRGEVVIGPDPPADKEISTSTLRLPSGLRGGDSISWDFYRPTAEDPPDNAKIAAHIVEGYFPPTHSQYLLEQDSDDREHIEYRYKRMAHLLFRYGNSTAANARAIDEQFRADRHPDAVSLNSLLITMFQKDIQTDSSTQDIDPDLTVDITVVTW